LPRNQSDERSETDIIIRMLYYCTEPRLPSQIMSFCDIDRDQFTRMSEHCIKKNLLKVVNAEMGMFGYVLTPRGRETLATAQLIMKELGVEDSEYKEKFHVGH